MLLRIQSVSKWIIVSASIVIAVFALISSSAIAIQDGTNLKDKAENLFLLLEKANATVVQVFHQLEARNIPIPNASLAEYNQALLLADESRSLLEAGNYSEANNEIIKALQKFREALNAVYETINSQPTEAEITFEKAISLKSSIDRSHQQLSQIENLTRVAATAGFNTSSLEVKIERVRLLLQNASNNLNQRRYEAASSNLAEAKVILGDLTLFLSNLAIELKTQRLETYITQTEERLSAIRQKAASLSNVASLSALSAAEASLSNAKEYLEKQLINETVSALVNSKESEDEAVQALKPVAPSLTAAETITPSALRHP